MTHLDPNDSCVIRITHQEVDSPHVDDMLKRQASLRGEAGITRDRKGKWYYRNWFLFMMAGALAAVGAWGILEPNFDDSLYLQGPLEEINLSEAMPTGIGQGDTRVEWKVRGTGWVKLNGQKVWVVSNARFIQPDGEQTPLLLDRLAPPRTIGVYVSQEALAQTGLAMAVFLLPDPPANPPAKARQTLQAQGARNAAVGLIFFGVVAALVSMAVGMADGIVCRVPRRALLAGAVGLLVGFLGGFISNFLAELVYTPLSTMAMRQEGGMTAGLSSFGFLLQTGGRGLAWALAGMAMGLAQGIALRSGRLLLYGFLGGIIGGAVGGLLFDPIDLLLLGSDKPSAHWSRMVGLLVIGASVGAMIGVVELLARDAWLRMVQGPLAGKEFVIFKDLLHLGSSPQSEIFLFNDPMVAPQHATIRSVGDNYEIETVARQVPVLINGRPVQRARLHHGDQIAIGRTVFAFQKRKG